MNEDDECLNEQELCSAVRAWYATFMGEIDALRRELRDIQAGLIEQLERDGNQ